jgi:hypothetical protein
MKTGDFKILFDGTKKFQETMKALAVSDVLVGIPEQANERKAEDEFDNMSNAAIGYVQEFGSDLAGIPPRPHLVPGVKNVEKEVAEEFKHAAQKSFSDPSAIVKHFTRAGIIASMSVKKLINDQTGFEPLSESTIAARKAEGFKGTKALIRTGQYRNAITYVVEGK